MSKCSVTVYNSGPLSCSVCAPTAMEKEEVEAETNRLHPCGTREGWLITETNFSGGEPNPFEDPNCPETRHWLLTA